MIGQLEFGLADLRTQLGEVLFVDGLLGLQVVLLGLEKVGGHFRFGVGVGHLLDGFADHLGPVVVDPGCRPGIALVHVVVGLCPSHHQPLLGNIEVEFLLFVVDGGQDIALLDLIAGFDVDGPQNPALLGGKIGGDVAVVDGKHHAVGHDD